MKPRIADLERMAQDYDQSLLHSEFHLAPLLRLARAAKEFRRLPTASSADEIDEALDAFDWRETTAADSFAAPRLP